MPYQMAIKYFSLWTKSLSVTWHPNGSFTKLLFIKLDNNMVLKKKKNTSFKIKRKNVRKNSSNQDEMPEYNHPNGSY